MVARTCARAQAHEHVDTLTRPQPHHSTHSKPGFYPANIIDLPVTKKKKKSYVEDYKDALPTTDGSDDDDPSNDINLGGDPIICIECSGFQYSSTHIALALALLVVVGVIAVYKIFGQELHEFFELLKASAKSSDLPTPAGEEWGALVDQAQGKIDMLQAKVSRCSLATRRGCRTERSRFCLSRV